MAIHKVALIRYKTIDQCLRNSHRKWTLEMLIEKVSEALYEYEGITGGVSKRTVQADIQLMRSDKLGYNAPIVVLNKRYYTYSESGYSINQSKVTDADVEKMSEIVSVLRQMNGFDYFDDMNDIIARLENSLHKSVNREHNHIQLEGNKLLKGLEHILPLYQAIRKKVPLLITYQSFKAKAPIPAVYHPYLLKEYRNRWFLITHPRKGSALTTLALDRIVEFMEMSPKDYIPYTGIDFERYFAETIGVTRSERDRPQKVVLWVHPNQAPYVLTKPLHHSQQLLRQEADGSIMIRINVTLNFELEREILGFGEMMRVLAPRNLMGFIRKRLQKATEQYATAKKELKSTDFGQNGSRIG
ncbi:helix-turn-helix transcriptional regulator [Chitinophaga rhizosphaerae]|uniref:helix-turn-helix transcriptional regulator n=1 Tax=Chitinophaga rhizosphaerae TaxID=1864947 RepID=UPI000F812E6C|nr:WYL domain-containing protein [Chitinophaga rhizosphaerae]